jgi:Caspase domain
MATACDDNAAAARTHALVIGVGRYTHLPGGAGTLARKTLGLSQLSSPPLSALAVARWLTNDLSNPGAPLGSLELLVSDSSGVPIEPWPAEPATMGNVKTAFNRWYERCDRNPGNVAIFFFCGHAVLSGRLALLLEDFGANERKLLDNAVDFEMTHLGMGDCRARTQLFIADACRELRPEALDLVSFDPVALADASRTTPGPLETPRIYATGRDRQAFARVGAPSLFTGALLSALNGLAAERERGTGRWTVTTGRLAPATESALERLRAVPGTPGQSCIGGGESPGRSVLHVLPEPPLVPVKVSCDPPAASDYASFSMRAGPARFTRDPTQGEWSTSVPAERYDVEATFPPGEYITGTGALWAQPPDGDETCLRVVP